MQQQAPIWLQIIKEEEKAKIKNQMTVFQDTKEQAKHTKEQAKHGTQLSTQTWTRPRQGP